MRQDSCTNTPPNNFELVNRFANEVWNEGQLDTLEQIFSHDLIVHYDHGDVHGINSWKEKTYIPFKSAISDLYMENIDCITSGNNAVANWKIEGIQTGELFGLPPSQESIKISGLTWYKIIDGKITEMWTQWNMRYWVQKLNTEIKKLKGILPVCCVCGLIRDDSGVERGKGEWMKVDKFVTQKTEALVSHSFCPKCLDKEKAKLKLP